jgi:hypothetical protein
MFRSNKNQQNLGFLFGTSVGDASPMAPVYSHALGETQKILAREERQKKNLMIISKDQAKPGKTRQLQTL